jgi:chaperone modulatory protein CbpM
MMAVRQYAIVLRRREGQQLSLNALAEGAGMHPSLVERFVECGLIEPVGGEGADFIFDASALPRLRVIGRLRESLSVNVAGIEVILNLLDRFCELQRENERLRSRL